VDETDENRERRIKKRQHERILRMGMDWVEENGTE